MAIRLTIKDACLLLACGLFLHVGGCDRPADPVPPKVKAARAEVARLEAERVAQLPGDPKTKAILARAEPYYADSKWIWSMCLREADRLTRSGYTTSAEELAEGMAEVMERLKIRPSGDQRMGAFFASYESRRKDPSRDDGRKGPSNHREAVDLLVRDEKFANRE